LLFVDQNTDKHLIGAIEYQHVVKWSLSREDVSERVRQQIDAKHLSSLLFKEQPALMLLI
jgi:hypothetical protein